MYACRVSSLGLRAASVLAAVLLCAALPTSAMAATAAVASGSVDVNPTTPVAAQKASDDGGAAPQNAVKAPAKGSAQDVPAANEACVGCHANEGLSAQNAKTLAGVHTTVACAACHDDEAALNKMHADVTSDDRMPRRLKKTSVASEICVSCHDQDEDAFIALAKGGAVTDANGLEVNPHEVIGEEQHAEIACVDCHEFHDESTPAEKTEKLCSSCHHAGVFECYTCHEHG